MPRSRALWIFPAAAVGIFSVVLGLTRLAGTARAEEAAAAGRKLAFLVGVKSYRHAELRDLEYPESDVKDLADVLKRHGFTVVLMSTSAAPTDKEHFPDVDNIRQQLAALLRGASKRDLILVGLAGHGLQPLKASQSYFCPHDANPSERNGDVAHPETLLSIGELLAQIRDSGIGQKLLLVDACRNDPEVRGGRRAVGTIQVDISTLPKRTGVLLSCDQGEFSFESKSFGSGHGAFFFQVIEGLNGAAKDEDGDITWDSLRTYVKKRVPATVRKVFGKDGGEQSPNDIGNLTGEPTILARITGPTSQPTEARSKAEPAGPPTASPVQPQGRIAVPIWVSNKSDTSPLEVLVTSLSEKEARVRVEAQQTRELGSIVSVYCYDFTQKQWTPVPFAESGTITFHVETDGKTTNWIGNFRPGPPKPPEPSFDTPARPVAPKLTFRPVDRSLRELMTQTMDKFAGTQAGQSRRDNGLNTTLVWIPGGSFTMGSPPDEQDRNKDEDQVQVTLSKGFWLSQHEVKQTEWQRVMKSEPWNAKLPSLADDKDYPATFVSWYDAMKFCETLTEQEHAAGQLPSNWQYTLPTEAQWEYACRGGTKSRFYFGDNESELGQYAWFTRSGSDTLNQATRVGARNPNPWGLNDMHGNVCEWCRDWYGEQLTGGTDPQGPSEGTLRVFRGGGFGNAAGLCRSATRSARTPVNRLSDVGFRVAVVQTSDHADQTLFRARTTFTPSTTTAAPTQSDKSDKRPIRPRIRTNPVPFGRWTNP